MKTTLQKLTEKLCEIREIKEDITGLRFWCVIWDHRYLWMSEEWYYYLAPIKISRNVINEAWYIEEEEMIWNPIQLHHLIWYCDSKDINLVITQKWYIWEPRERYSALLDITKDLSNQSEETLEKILNFITE